MNEDLERIKSNPEMLVRYMATKRFINFARYIYPKLEITPFHRAYYDVLDKFAHGKIRKLIVSCPPQAGKALQVDTPVLTTEGWKKHGDLAPGDYVFGDDGKPKRVIWNSGSYIWHTMYVDFADGFSLVASHEHLWKLQCDRDTRTKGQRRKHIQRIEEVLETQDIFRGKHRRNPFIPADCGIEMPERELPIDPYLLGYWLGDGYSQNGRICSGGEDAWNLAQFGEVQQQINGHEIPYFVVNVIGLAHTLRINGLINNKHIPIEYLLSSREQRMELLQGLMDTDGSVSADGGRCEFSQMKGQLADDVYVLIRSLGYKATRHEKRAMLNGKDCGISIRIAFSPNKGDKIFRLPRKQMRLDNKTPIDRKDKTRFFITNTSENGLEIVNCIQVEGGMYLAGYELVPTHNSTGSSRLLPAFLLGLNPDLKIIIGSYNAEMAKSFNYDVQKIINEQAYKAVFPNSFLNTARVRMDNVYKCNSEVSEMVGHSGFLRAVGRSGPLTGRSVDISILDDVYKDYSEANSGLVRELAWKWYTTVVRTRLHNDSKELIVFTRWHEDDIIGRLEKSGEKIIVVKSPRDLENVPKNAWVHFNFPALKVGPPTEIDPRNDGEALWPSKHSKEKLLASKALDPIQFECLYQGDPGSAEGRLYGDFKTYSNKDDWGRFVRSGCYIDVADQGSDELASVTYDVYRSKGTTFNEKKKRFEPIYFILVTDIILTGEGTDITYVSVPAQINLNRVTRVWCESNNGGEQFGKTIEKKVKAQVVRFYNGKNKEARILTNASVVNQHIIMPLGWENRYPHAEQHLRRFLRNFAGNAHDDIEDCLTGIIEKEILSEQKSNRKGIRRAN